MPVLPLVGSMIVSPCFSVPLRSATSYHGYANPIFDAAGGIEVFQFAENVGF